jgi:GTPase
MNDIITDEDDNDISQENTGNDIIETEYIIDGVYMVTGVGLVVGGTIKKGSISIGQTLMIGPDKNGHFKPVIVKGMHENRVDIETATKG